MGNVWLNKIRSYILKAAIAEAVLILVAIICWLAFTERSLSGLMACLLVTGILFVAFGSFIYASAHNSTKMEVNRKAFYRGNADPAEASSRAWSDADESYSIGGLLFWAGTAAIGIVFLVRGFV